MCIAPHHRTRRRIQIQTLFGIPNDRDSKIIHAIDVIFSDSISNQFDSRSDVNLRPKKQRKTFFKFHLSIYWAQFMVYLVYGHLSFLLSYPLQPSFPSGKTNCAQSLYLLQLLSSKDGKVTPILAARVLSSSLSLSLIYFLSFLVCTLHVAPLKADRLVNPRILLNHY